MSFCGRSRRDPGRCCRSRCALRRELLPRQPRKFAILAEGPLEEIRRLGSEIEHLTATMAVAEPMPA